MNKNIIFGKPGCKLHLSFPLLLALFLTFRSAFPVWASSSSMPEIPDGTYEVVVDLAGGTGRATVNSPCEITVASGQITARIEWSSPNYDYMKVGDEKYVAVNTEGNSVFEIPVTAFDEPIDVIGDTLAMSTPHEIEYTLTFHSEGLPAESSGPSEMWTTLPVMILVVLTAGYYYYKKKNTPTEG